MLPIKKAENRVTKSEDRIVWKTDFWKRKTSIFYAGREIGYLKINGIFFFQGVGILLDREFEIKATNFWYDKFVIIDKTGSRQIAIIKKNRWLGRFRLFIEEDVFRFKHNMWGTGNWWWQRENGTQEEQSEKLIKTSISNYLTGKGTFNFGNTGDSNLNALILGGLFAKALHRQMYNG